MYSPDRVLHPLVRTGPKGSATFEQVTWDDALARIADRWQRLIDQHGPASILPFGYAGNQGILQCRTMSERLFNVLGTSTVVDPDAVLPASSTHATATSSRAPATTPAGRRRWRRRRW